MTNRTLDIGFILMFLLLIASTATHILDKPPTPNRDMAETITELSYANDVLYRQAQTDRDMLRSCRDQLGILDLRYQSDLVMIAIRGAERYGVKTNEYVAAGGE